MDDHEKTLSIGKVERMVLWNLISAAWKNRFVDSEETADALKSIKAKIGFSQEELARFNIKRAGDGRNGSAPDHRPASAETGPGPRL